MINWHEVLGVIAALLAVSAIIPYIRDIFHGTTRPNIFTFALWEVLISISIFAQISSGASWSLLVLVGDFVGTGVVVVLCLFGWGYGKYGWLEWTCTALAIVAIVSWQVTSQPVLAICFAILADAMAATPTVVKTFRDPWSETPWLWLVVALGAACAVASSTIFDAANILFPAYLLFINGLIGVLAFFGRRLKSKPELA